MKQTGVVLLAAGSAERYGHDKRLAAVTVATASDKSHAVAAEPMLLASIRTVRASGMPFIVVLRSGDLQWEQELDAMGVDWTTCPEAHKGMGYSLAAGVHATQHWDGWLIAMADMPFIHPATFQTLAESLNQHDRVRPVFVCPESGKLRGGHPLAFGKSCAFALMQCAGDEDAITALLSPPNKVHDIICADSGIIRDVDLPGDH